MVGRLEGKTAIITGAGSIYGIGCATAKLFAAEGASVVVTDIDAAGLDEVVASIDGNGGSVVAEVHDVTRQAEWSGIVERTIARSGRVDILVNNAGGYLAEDIAKTSIEQLDRLIDINIRGLFIGCQAVVPEMRKTGGVIINMSSVAALIGVPNSSAYACTKGAVAALTRTIAVDEAHNGIRCNSIHPGTIETAMVREVIAGDAERRQRVAASVPLQRLGEPSDIAYGALYLASDEARYVTGVQLVIDGGRTVQ